MEEKYCKNCLFSRPLLTTTNENLVECKYEGPRYDDRCVCDRWASRYVDEAHEEKAFDVTKLKSSDKRYIFCNINHKTCEAHLVVKLDLKFKTKAMFPDTIYNMTIQELLNMEE